MPPTLGDLRQRFQDGIISQEQYNLEEKAVMADMSLGAMPTAHPPHTAPRASFSPPAGAADTPSPRLPGARKRRGAHKMKKRGSFAEVRDRAPRATAAAAATIADR